jgi:hypothetical protein
MTLVWNNCKLVYDGKNTFGIARKGKQKFKNFVSKWGKSNVWWDPKTKKLFSINQNSDKGAVGIDRSFLCCPNDFLTKVGNFCVDCGGKVFCDEIIGKVLGFNTINTSEYMIENSEVFKRAKDSTIMIVGGGPSAVEVDWTQYEYDQLWSCNHFFLNDKLKERNVDLWIAGDEVDLLGDERLHEYLKTAGVDSWCCLYPTRAPVQRVSPQGTHQYIRELQKVLPRITYAHLRYRSKIGIVPRLLLLAIFAGARKVYVVGMDGVPNAKTPHAFQPGKNPKGTCAKPDAYDIFRIQYVQLWDYIIHYLKPTTQIINLGENTKTNLSADITKVSLSML